MASMGVLADFSTTCRHLNVLTKDHMVSGGIFRICFPLCTMSTFPSVLDPSVSTSKYFSFQLVNFAFLKVATITILHILFNLYCFCTEQFAQNKKDCENNHKVMRINSGMKPCGFYLWLHTVYGNNFGVLQWHNDIISKDFWSSETPDWTKRVDTMVQVPWDWIYSSLPHWM